jgi:hypothetical protein
MATVLRLILRRLPKGQTEQYFRYEVLKDGSVIVTD